MFISALARVVLAAAIVATPTIGLTADSRVPQTKDNLDDLRSRQDAIEIRQQYEKNSIIQQVDALKNRVNDKVDALNTRVNDKVDALKTQVNEAKDKITDVYNSISVFGIIITVLGLALGNFAIRRAEDKAREAARRSANDWMDERARELKAQIEALAAQVAQVEAQAKNAQQIMKAAELETERKAKEAQETLDRIQKDLDVGKPPSQDEQKVPKGAEDALRGKPDKDYSAEDWTERGLAAYAEKKFEDAATYFRRAAETLGASQFAVAQALSNKGVALSQLNNFDCALAAFNEVLARFRDTSEPTLRLQVAKALFNKGVVLARTKHFDDALAAYNEALSLFEDASKPEPYRQVASALVGKGAALGQLKKFKDALEAFDEVLARFKAPSEPALREQVARALVGKGASLAALDRPDDALEAYNEVLVLFKDAAEPELREQVRKVKDALSNMKLGDGAFSL